MGPTWLFGEDGSAARTGFRAGLSDVWDTRGARGALKANVAGEGQPSPEDVRRRASLQGF